MLLNNKKARITLKNMQPLLLKIQHNLRPFNPKPYAQDVADSSFKKYEHSIIEINVINNKKIISQ